MRYSKILFVACSVVSMSAQAQFGNYSEADMQRMMENAQKGMLQAGQCFAGIDQAALNALADRGKAMEAKIAALCKQGNEKQASNEAMQFAREIAADKNIAAMRKCGEQMKGTMPDIPFANYQGADDAAEESGGICAGY
ncbi:MAG: hypothetical protein HKO84_03385 [Pseudomonadales bacterium]|nr:hypothetical protein [Pseudomonadales bacterium]